MRETAEFRVDEDFASRLFADDEGEKLGIVRKIKISRDDPRFARIGEIDCEIKSKTMGAAFFYGWRIKRQYTRKEFGDAKVFKLVIGATFEPAGEVCGTRYDESTACPKCGAGAAQVSDLRIDLRRVPKGKDIARTIADEWIVSQRLAERMVDAGLTGFQFRRVHHKARYEDDPVELEKLVTGREIMRKAETARAPFPTDRFYIWINRPENKPLMAEARAEMASIRRERARARDKPAPVWHQLIVTTNAAEVVAPTRVGITPFDEDVKGECRCPLGDLIGLNLLSEVSIDATSRGDTDVVCTRQFLGARGGLLRPARLMLVSPRFREVFESANAKGSWFEVAHLV